MLANDGTASVGGGYVVGEYLWREKKDKLMELIAKGKIRSSQAVFESDEVGVGKKVWVIGENRGELELPVKFRDIIFKCVRGKKGPGGRL